jgi:glycosyltransferase involved in cell wall biosynthesis
MQDSAVVRPALIPAVAAAGRPKIVVVMPAYNAEKTLEYTYRSIPPSLVDEVILVDDGSRDQTARLSRDLGLTTIPHPHNAGYGANQKTCYTEALFRDAEIVIMLHPDGQYDPAIIPDMVAVLAQGQAEVVLGSRLLTPGGALKGGMPLYKFLANRWLTWIENLVLGQRLSEYHTGYRAYTRRVLETVPYLRNSNDFVFDTQFLFQAIAMGFRVKEVPVSTRYFSEASSISLASSLKYGLATLGVAARYLAHRAGWRSRLYIH